MFDPCLCLLACLGIWNVCLLFFVLIHAALKWLICEALMISLMDPITQFAAGFSAISLGAIAYLLVPISDSAKNFNYCVEQKVAYWVEKEGKLNPWTRSNQVAFCNGKVYKIKVSNLKSNQ